MDYAKEEIMRQADKALRLYPGSSVYFKYTCEACGERVMFQEANMIYDNGECGICGHVTEGIRGYGIFLHLWNKGGESEQ